MESILQLSHNCGYSVVLLYIISAGYEQVRSFAEIICRMANEQLPKFTSMERNLKKRGNKIYLDYLQNSRGQTIAAAYSVRPHPGAIVSIPLLWKG